MLPGLMQDRPLLISSLIEHAATFHGDVEIVSRLPEGAMHRTTWHGVRERAKQAANALTRLGVKQSDRVGTLAWNSHRHLTLYFGVSGMGAVLHTVNPRLFPEQIDYIVNHAENQVLFFDIGFAQLVEQLAPRLKTVRHFVAMTDRAHMPDVKIPGLLCYEELLDAESVDYDWPVFDERAASSLCYTSGTTGNPKGVLYSHRSTILHTLMQLSPDASNLGAASTILLIVPMFHCNAWGTPYAGAMAGSKLVLPGPHLDGQSVYTLLRDERCTVSQGVPTVWMMLFHYLDANPQINPRDIGLKTVSIGGAAVSAMMIQRFEDDFGAEVTQGWGMTETSPLGVNNRPLPKHQGWSREQLMPLKLKQGRGIWGVEIKVIGPDGQRLPWDGVSSGDLYVRGPWIASGYFKGEGGSVLDAEGYLPTGDVVTMTPDGYLQLVDRSKDVIKSGGEWISSIDLENTALSHPAVAEAAVIAIPHPKWQERPLLIVALKPGQQVSARELLDYLASKIAKWWVPDDVVFVDSLPHTATGKLLKTKLREQFGGHRLPTID